MGLSNLLCICLCFILLYSAAYAADPEEKAKHKSLGTAEHGIKKTDHSTVGNEETYTQIENAFNSFCGKQATKSTTKATGKTACCNALRKFVANKYKGTKRNDGGVKQKIGKLFHKDTKGGTNDIKIEQVPECKQYRSSLQKLLHNALNKGNSHDHQINGNKMHGQSGHGGSETSHKMHNMFNKLHHDKTKTNTEEEKAGKKGEGHAKSLMHPMGGKKKNNAEDEKDSEDDNGRPKGGKKSFKFMQKMESRKDKKGPAGVDGDTKPGRGKPEDEDSDGDEVKTSKTLKHSFSMKKSGKGKPADEDEEAAQDSDADEVKTVRKVEHSELVKKSGGPPKDSPEDGFQSDSKPGQKDQLHKPKVAAKENKNDED